MRLKQIKLAGFKSFVDPTKVPFPAQMTAIVGPNGCGKSNIIDAVRWVLGESSAKNLRGDAMTDVIFNGSSARKPVSQASIELIFDNSAGRLAGEYANYNEISVKRSVNRDPTSQYFLNGHKCRKKDITDLFLGTGLGPRSYSIIEQGMISRLIESKPQELRLFIEEAAGISKYKERRRETENRIRHTRENLERLEDVIAELNQQLEKLQRQASAAKRYKALKQQERDYKAQLNVLKWQRLTGEADQLEQKMNQLKLELEQLTSHQRGDEAQLQNLRIRQFQARQALEDITQNLFKHAQAISRAEQNLVHLKAQKTQLIQQKNKNDAILSQLLESINEAEQALQQSQIEYEALAPELDFCDEKLAELAIQIEAAEQDGHQASQALSRQAKAFHQLDNQVKTQQQQYQSTQQLIGSEQQRLAVSQSRLSELNQQQSVNLEQISEEKSIAQARCETIQEQITSSEAQLQIDLSNLRTKQLQQQGLTGEQQKLEAQIASLNVLISKQTKPEQSSLDHWFAECGIQSVSELYGHIKVQPGWEVAVDTVLNQWQKAYLIEQDLPNVCTQIPAHSLSLVSNITPESNVLIAEKSQHASLDDKVEAPWPILSILAKVAIVESGNINNQVINDLLHQDSIDSVICENGFWQGRGWQVLAASTQDNLFVLQQERDDLNVQLQSSQQNIAQISLEIERLTEATDAAQLQVKQCEQSLAQSQQRIYQLQSQWDAEQNKLNYQAEQKQQLEFDIDELRLSIEIQTEKQLALEDAMAASEEALEQAESEYQIDEIASQSAQNKLTALREQRETQLQNQYQTKLNLEQLTHQISTHQASLENAQHKLVDIETEQAEIAERLIEIELPQETESESLQELIEQKTQQEQEKLQANDDLAEVESLLADIEKGQHSLLAKQQTLKDEINQLALDQEGYRVRAKSVLEVLNELNTSLKHVLETLPPEAEEENWQTQLDKTGQSIKRLGAINLAAIEEYDHQAERKDYLDAQHQDLIAALNTLEDAIRKIDRETKAKFSNTFEAVNQDLQQLFPKVFGGGAAWLELTDDDLLETGVSIMARPPGKRNSTIHLLSGGEKALTALSLVFAIFRLNPAPFCMLDEVDAPLDDANVGRFCRLVQEMSSSVQFVFISHNKIAMEMATHLVGVTMQEPGVSRMVAVDIDKAIELAELE
ncbi:chromosome segregation protein SMC [Catenovulum adriaticum]